MLLGYLTMTVDANQADKSACTYLEAVMEKTTNAVLPKSATLCKWNELRNAGELHEAAYFRQRLHYRLGYPSPPEKPSQNLRHHLRLLLGPRL